MKQKMNNSGKLFGIVFLSILYLEILFKIRLFESVSFNMELFRIVLFSFSYSLMIMFFLMFFGKKTVFILLMVFLSFVTFAFLNQEIYSSIVNQFYSVTVAGDFTLGLSFINKYFESLRFSQITYLLPIVTILLLRNLEKISFDVMYTNIKHPLIIISTMAIAFFLSLQSIDERIEEGIDESIAFSDMDLYTFMFNPQVALKKFGLLTYTQRDFFSLFRVDPLTPQDYEVLLDKYLAEKKVPPLSGNNEYTGIYEDKNFILIMAESLDTYAIDDMITPTLYQFAQESAYFENFFSPLYYRSTADTEFLVQTSFYPNKNVTLSMTEYIDNYFPYTLPKLFKATNKSYQTYSYHNYTDYFYPRTQFHIETLGYDNYKGAATEFPIDPSDDYYISTETDSKGNEVDIYYAGLGLLPEPVGIVNNHNWQSDVALFERSLPDFINNNGKFFANYITVSGHFRYSKDHEVGMLHYQWVIDQFEANDDRDTPDDSIIYYLAANKEFDLALDELKTSLIEAGQWDNTVIMIFGDHYAYAIDDEVIWDYDENKVEGDLDSELRLHNVPMMICVGDGTTTETANCSGGDDNILQGTISNYMSTIDIIPTVANLFNLPLDDYRLVFGEDALSTDKNIVRFADMSFISKDFSYDSLSEKYALKNGFISDSLFFKTYYYNIVNEYEYNLNMLNLDYFRDQEDVDN